MNLINLLLSLILSVTGIERTVDPAMTAEAERRVEMIQSDFSHNGITTPEVLAWNSGYPDGTTATERAVQQWRESPVHWEILTDPSLTRIGCAIDQVGERWYFVCALAQGGATQSAEPAPYIPPTTLPSAPPPSYQPPTPQPVTLPDTAMTP